jgi:predicted amidohydrolase
VRVAAVAWKIRPVRSDGEFLAHFHDLVSMAHDEGAELVVIPENQVLELMSLAPDVEDRHIPRFLMQFADEIESWIARISSSSGMIIVGGSHYRETEQGIGAFSATGTPHRGVVLTPRTHLDPFERHVMNLRSGQGLKVLPDSRVAVTVREDVAFPEASLSLADAGVRVQCVPAFTATRHAFQRVRWSCHARSSECGLFLIHASLVGGLGRPPARTTYGSSAVLAPSIDPFPDHAALAETEANEEGVVFADLDFAALEEARKALPALLEREGTDWKVG